MLTVLYWCQKTQLCALTSSTSSTLSRQLVTRESRRRLNYFSETTHGKVYALALPSTLRLVQSVNRQSFSLRNLLDYSNPFHLPRFHGKRLPLTLLSNFPNHPTMT